MGGELGQQFRAASIAEPITPPHTTESVSEHIRSLTRGPAAVYQCAVLGRFQGFVLFWLLTHRLCVVLLPVAL